MPRGRTATENIVADIRSYLLVTERKRSLETIERELHALLVIFDAVLEVAQEARKVIEKYQFVATSYPPGGCPYCGAEGTHSEGCWIEEVLTDLKSIDQYTTR